MNKNKTSILIIEDEEPERLSLLNVLEADGYSVCGAANAAETLDMVNRQFFDILLVDYKLPDANGIDLIKQILQISKESVPVVVTGFSSLEIAVESMRIGAHDYVVKPINIDELKKNIESIVLEHEALTKGRENLPVIVKRLEIIEAGTIIVARQNTREKRNSAFSNLINPFIIVAKQMKRYFWDIY